MVRSIGVATRGGFVGMGMPWRLRWLSRICNREVRRLGALAALHVLQLDGGLPHIERCGIL